MDKSFFCSGGPLFHRIMGPSCFSLRRHRTQAGLAVSMIQFGPLHRCCWETFDILLIVVKWEFICLKNPPFCKIPFFLFFQCQPSCNEQHPGRFLQVFRGKSASGPSAVHPCCYARRTLDMSGVGREPGLSIQRHLGALYEL